jgi:hypothetical protein
MKEITITSKDKTEISIQKKQQKEKELIGNLVPYGNHKIWEINNETLEINEAKYEQVSFIIGKQIEGQNNQIITVPNHSYISAMNKRTALKKFKSGSNGSKLQEKPAFSLNELKF